MNPERKVPSVLKDRKVNALLFAHSSETKFGFGFGRASYMKTKLESALRKHPNMCLKKNQNAPRPSEHPPVKTFRWADQRLQIPLVYA